MRSSHTRSSTLTLAALAVAVCAAWPPAHASTPGVDAPPDAGTPGELSVPHIEEALLLNGVRVVVVPKHDLPLVTVALHLKLGAAADPDGQAGLASLTNTLRSKGATVKGQHLDATQLARAAEALGGSLDSNTGFGGSSLSMTVPTTKLAAAVALVSDVMLHPTLDGAELERLREQTADGLKFSMSDPMALAGLVAKRDAWGASVYGGSLTPASLARITLADVQAFHRTQLRPALATLVFSGDVTRTQALDLATTALAGWKDNKRALPQARHEAASPVTPTTVLVDLKGAGQSGVVVMSPSVAVNSPERRVAQVATAVLGGGYSARLNAEVRIKRGLSYGASASHAFEPVGGLLIAATQTNNPTAAEVVTLVRGEIAKLGQQAPATDELAARQATLVGNFGRQIETTAGLSATVLNQVAHNKPLSDIEDFPDEVLAVTPEQVRDFAAKHWQAAQLRTVVVGDLGAAGDSLKTLDPKALVIPVDKLVLEAPGLTP
jgi:zinc protease